jgi:hypothetical protein
VKSVSSIAKALGKRGGQARAKRLSAERKKAIAAQGGRSRAESLQLKRCIEENFKYVAAIQELQGGPVKVKHVKTWKHRLPSL